jgi:mannose-6-phosphate isomerase-like protein (cupin superfamily)
MRIDTPVVADSSACGPMDSVDDEMTGDSAGDAAADLLGLNGTGPVWGMASSDLNATLLVWPGGHELDEHVNGERDVLLVVLEGEVVAAVDGHDHALVAGNAFLIGKGRARSLRAGADGVRYLSVHVRRSGLQIEALG